MRRVNITGGNLTLMDYCTAGPQYASGGFIADSQTGFIINGSQQQFLVRDSSIGGVQRRLEPGLLRRLGAPPQSFSTTPYDPPPYTTLATSPLTREKPFLYVDTNGAYNVFLPALRQDSSGTTWSSGPAAGCPSIRSSSSPGHRTAQAINNAWRGSDLILPRHLSLTGFRGRRPTAWLWVWAWPPWCRRDCGDDGRRRKGVKLRSSDAGLVIAGAAAGRHTARRTRRAQPVE
jgi:hypothetical protein